MNLIQGPNESGLYCLNLLHCVNISHFLYGEFFWRFQFQALTTFHLCASLKSLNVVESPKHRMKTKTEKRLCRTPLSCTSSRFRRSRLETRLALQVITLFYCLFFRVSSTNYSSREIRPVVETMESASSMSPKETIPPRDLLAPSSFSLFRVIYHLIVPLIPQWVGMTMKSTRRALGHSLLNSLVHSRCSIIRLLHCAHSFACSLTHSPELMGKKS